MQLSLPQQQVRHMLSVPHLSSQRPVRTTPLYFSIRTVERLIAYDIIRIRIRFAIRIRILVRVCDTMWALAVVHTQAGSTYRLQFAQQRFNIKFQRITYRLQFVIRCERWTAIVFGRVNVKNGSRSVRVVCEQCDVLTWGYVRLH